MVTEDVTGGSGGADTRTDTSADTRTDTATATAHPGPPLPERQPRVANYCGTRAARPLSMVAEDVTDVPGGAGGVDTSADTHTDTDTATAHPGPPLPERQSRVANYCGTRAARPLSMVAEVDDLQWADDVSAGNNDAGSAGSVDGANSGSSSAVTGQTRIANYCGTSAARPLSMVTEAARPLSALDEDAGGGGLAAVAERPESGLVGGAGDVPSVAQDQDKSHRVAQSPNSVRRIKNYCGAGRPNSMLGEAKDAEPEHVYSRWVNNTLYIAPPFFKLAVHGTQHRDVRCALQSLTSLSRVLGAKHVSNLQTPFYVWLVFRLQRPGKENAVVTMATTPIKNYCGAGRPMSMLEEIDAPQTPSVTSEDGSPNARGLQAFVSVIHGSTHSMGDMGSVSESYEKQTCEARLDGHNIKASTANTTGATASSSSHSSSRTDVVDLEDYDNLESYDGGAAHIPPTPPSITITHPSFRHASGMKLTPSHTTANTFTTANQLLSLAPTTSE